MARWVLFDLDGTLTDPKPGITGCIAYAMTQLGRTSPPLDELTWCIGPPLRGSFCELVGEGLADEALVKYRERFAEVGLFENQVYPEVSEALEATKRAGYRLALATSKPLVYAERIVEHFGLRGAFDSLYGSELDGVRADKGELIGYILATEGIKAEDVVMVGDRRHDIAGAKANGVRGIGVLYGYGSEDELKAAGAVQLCATPVEIPAAVEAVFGG
jgi:phosphoglycolate phosphatase